MPRYLVVHHAPGVTPEDFQKRVPAVANAWTHPVAIGSVTAGDARASFSAGGALFHR